MAIYRGDGGAGVANPTYETAVIADQTGNSGKYLTTNGTNTSWATVTGGSTNLDGLTDVVLTSPSSGQVLKYNGTNWINDTDATGSGSFTYPGAGIAVSTGSAWGTSLTDNSANWDTAYTDRFKWDGGATGLTASTGRTSLGVTATGADTTYAYRANNLSDLASASTARTNLGLGTAATMTGPTGTIVGTTDTQTLTNKTLTSPRVGTAVLDTNGNEVFAITATASAVNDITLVNAATGNVPQIQASGTDTNVSLNLVPKGTGTIQVSGVPIVTTTATQTVTNKRVTPRVSTTTSSATPTINTDNVDMFGLTALAVNITSFTTNLSGTPTDGQTLWIYIVGTAARTITWGASFEASTVALPTTTVTTNRLDVGFVWNAATSKWRCIAVA